MTAQPKIKIILFDDILETVVRLKLDLRNLISPRQFFDLYVYNEELDLSSTSTQKIIYPPDSYEGFYKNGRLIVLHQFIMRTYNINDINSSVPEIISSRFPDFTRWLEGQRC